MQLYEDKPEIVRVPYYCVHSRTIDTWYLQTPQTPKNLCDVLRPSVPSYVNHEPGLDMTPYCEDARRQWPKIFEEMKRRYAAYEALIAPLFNLPQLFIAV